MIECKREDSRPFRKIANALSLAYNEQRGSPEVAFMAIFHFTLIFTGFKQAKLGLVYLAFKEVCTHINGKEEGFINTRFFKERL